MDTWEHQHDPTSPTSPAAVVTQPSVTTNSDNQPLVPLDQESLPTVADSLEGRLSPPDQVSRVITQPTAAVRSSTLAQPLNQPTLASETSALPEAPNLAASLVPPIDHGLRHSLRQLFRFRGHRLVFGLSSLVLIAVLTFVGLAQLLNNSTDNTTVSSSTDKIISENTAGDITFNRDTIIAEGYSFTVNGPATFQNATDSESAFVIQNAQGGNLLSANTIDNIITIVGDLQINGDLIVSGGSTSLADSGLVINNNTVCTAQGCTPLESDSGGGSGSSGSTAIDDSQLSDNVTLQGNTFNGASQLVQLTNGGILPVLSGANLTNLNADNIDSGTLADARLSANVSLLGQTIESAELTDGTIVNADIAVGAAIAYGKLNLADSITAADLTANSVGSSEIATDAVTADEIATGAVASAEISNGSIINEDINAAAAIDWSKISKTGSSLADLDTRSAADLTSGTLNDARLSANVALLDGTGPQTFSGNNRFNGTFLLQSAVNSATAFQVLNADGTAHLIVADTLAARVAIGLPAPSYMLDVGGDINTTTGYRIGGVEICAAGGCTAASGSGSYIQNGTALQSANFAIQSAANTSIGGVIRGAAGQSADLLNLIAGDSGNIVVDVAASGAINLKNDSDSISAFNVEDAAGADLLTVNTTAGTVTIAGLSADGSSLTNLNASNIASGTLDVARLDASVSLLGQTIESGEITNGTITNDDINVAAAIADTKLDTISTAGKVADTALSANVTLQGNTFNGVSQLVQTTAGGILPVISGANLTSLNGSSIASGTVADARLSANVALLDGSQTFSGAPLFKKSADSTTAFRIQNAAGTNLFVADTTNSRIYIGEPTADATGALLVLDTKNTAGDPTCVDGGLYYNSNAVQARACINGAWNNAVGTNTGTTIPTTNLYDGRTFRLRAGSTPYDFLDLTYDATYGKWVSAEQSAESFSQYDSTYANNTNYVDFLTDADGTNPYVHARWLPWATLDTAGLVPQFRWIGQMYNRPAGGSTAYIKLAYRGVNASEKYGVRAFVEVGGEVTTTAAPASLVTKDTGWVQIPGGYTVKDFIVPHLIGKATSGQSVAFGGEILVRWVSQ